METILYLVAAISLAGLIVGILALAKLKNITYLLEQPVVKKLAPEMKMKAVNIRPDGQVEGRRAPPARSESGRGNQEVRQDGDRRPRGDRNRGQRDSRDARGERGERPERGDRAPRSERPEGDRQERGERMDRSERQDRQERSDRNGNGRGRDRDRGDRGDRGERARRNGFPESADGGPATETQDSAPAPLAPRRPLAATIEAPEPSYSAPESDADAQFAAEGGHTAQDGDIQHGRRTQLKKKPRFDVEDAELSPAEEAKA